MEVRKEFHHHRLWRNFSTFLKVSHLLSFLCLNKLTEGEPAWFQVCNENNQFALNTLDCQLGLWLEQPLRIGCACVNGVWLLSSGLCDEDATILVGSGDCFSLRKKVQSIKFIGNKDDPFAPASYLVSSDMASFTKIPENGYSSSMDTSSSFLLSINPQKAFVRAHDDECIEPSERNFRNPVHIIRNPRRRSNSFKKVNFGTCQNPRPFKYHVGFGESYQNGVVSKIDQVAYDCSSKCVTRPNHLNQPRLNFGRSIGVSGRFNTWSHADAGGTGNGAASSDTSKFKTDILWSGLYLLNRKLTFVGGYRLSTAQREEKQNIFKSRLVISEPKIVFQRETREQTVRMVQAHTNYLLLNQRTKKINSREYTYFQIARRVFLAVVPQDIFPANVVNAITRMWRQLLWESHDKFPYTESTDEDRHQRVVKELEVCLENATKIDPKTVGFWTANKNSSHHCLKETKYSYHNYTKENIPVNIETVPEWLKADFTKMDFVVEMAWKISLFLHYRCVEIFKDNNPSDLSYYFEKLMSLFNQKIIKRWHNPEESVKVYQMLFNNYNIDDLGFIMDGVVNHIEKTQKEFRFWLVRPKVPISFEDIPFKENRSQRLKRSKMRSRVNSFWGGRGNCMSSFTDPIQNFGVKPSLDCYISEPND